LLRPLKGTRGYPYTRTKEGLDSESSPPHILNNKTKIPGLVYRSVCGSSLAPYSGPGPTGVPLCQVSIWWPECMGHYRKGRGGAHSMFLKVWWAFDDLRECDVGGRDVVVPTQCSWTCVCLCVCVFVCVCVCVCLILCVCNPPFHNVQICKERDSLVAGKDPKLLNHTAYLTYSVVKGCLKLVQTDEKRAKDVAGVGFPTYLSMQGTLYLVLVGLLIVWALISIF